MGVAMGEGAEEEEGKKERERKKKTGCILAKFAVIGNALITFPLPLRIVNAGYLYFWSSASGSPIKPSLWRICWTVRLIAGLSGTKNM